MGVGTRWAAAMGLGLALTLTSACTVDLSGLEEPSSTPGRTAGSTGSPGTIGVGGTPTAGPAVSEAELQQDIESARQVVDGYWSTHWTDTFTGSYSPPQIRGAYDGDDLASAPTCGDEAASKFNAFYCMPDDYIAWDIDLMRYGYSKGDAWVYVVIAHEWGHAIQNRLKTELVAEKKELQADCLAGAVLYGAAADGTLEFEEGDREEILDAFKELGDKTPWTTAADHGDAFERIAAFGQGKSGGIKGCFATTT